VLAFDVADVPARVLDETRKVFELLRLLQHVHQAFVVFFHLSDFEHISAWRAAFFLQINLLDFILLLLKLFDEKIGLSGAGRDFLLEYVRLVPVLLVGLLQRLNALFLKS